VVLARHRLAIAHVRQRSGQSPQLTAWESFARESADLAILKRLRGGGRIGAGQTILLLPHGQYQLLQVEPSAVAEPELRDALRWRIKDMVDFPVEEAGIDCLPIPVSSAGRGEQLYVVAASQGVLKSWIRLFQDAKAPLQAIDVPELAQRNIAALFEEENRALALLAFDESGGRLTFTYRGELYFARHIEMSPDEMVAAQGDPAGLYERVLLDVQRTLDNVDRSYSAISIARLLVSPVPGALAFVDYLKENLYQAVDILDLNQRLDLSQVPALADPALQGPALLAIGAALRETGRAPI
jgi:MSHA biogenesis protein MshI